MRNAALISNNELTQFVVDMRNYYQHRGSLEVCVGQYGLNAEYGTYSILDLRSVAREYSVTVPEQWLGPLGDGYIQPILYQHSLTRHLAVLLESVITSTSWPDADWWRGERNETVESDWLIDARKRQWWW